MHRAKKTIAFAAALGIARRFTPACRTQGNGMAEALVIAFKKGITFFCNDRPDAQTVMAQFAGWLDDYNKKGPHRPCEYSRLVRVSVHCKTWRARFSGGNSRQAS